MFCFLMRGIFSIFVVLTSVWWIASLFSFIIWSFCCLYIFHRSSKHYAVVLVKKFFMSYHTSAISCMYLECQRALVFGESNWWSCVGFVTSDDIYWFLWVPPVLDWTSLTYYFISRSNSVKFAYFEGCDFEAYFCPIMSNDLTNIYMTPILLEPKTCKILTL